MAGLEEALREINKKLSELSNKIEITNTTVNVIKKNQEALQDRLLKQVILRSVQVSFLPRL
jgi:hypothetical protein